MPFCFVSAARACDIPPDIADATLVAKPYRAADLRARIRGRRLRRLRPSGPGSTKKHPARRRGPTRPPCGACEEGVTAPTR